VRGRRTGIGRRLQRILRSGGRDQAPLEVRSRGLRASIFWSLVDQGFSSGTTFFFTVLAARNLGPSGLGTIALGFAAYLVAVGLERALIITPLLTRESTSERDPGEALKAAVSATVAGGLVCTLAALSIGTAADGAWARGLLVFAPWLVPVLAYVLLRTWLYRVARSQVAAVSSAVWLGTMLVAAGAGLRSTDMEITAAWGVGACAAAVFAASMSESFGFARPRATARWLADEAAHVGGWLAGSSILFNVLAYARIGGLSAILGPAAVGGYRAVETAFAPSSLTAEALTYSGLPALRDAVERDRHAAWRLAVKLSALNLALVATYVAIVVVFEDLVFVVFGEGFREYQFLVAPIAAGQLVTSLGTGFSILLVAARMMREVTYVVLVQGILLLGFGVALAAASGLEATAWGMAFAAIPSLVLVVLLARRGVVGAGSSPT
jgi:O-antigen/teichoic acid export membrane protein